MQEKNITNIAAHISILSNLLARNFSSNYINIGASVKIFLLYFGDRVQMRPLIFVFKFCVCSLLSYLYLLRILEWMV
jgi:hypothetical protein